MPPLYFIRKYIRRCTKYTTKWQNVCAILHIENIPEGVYNKYINTGEHKFSKTKGILKNGKNEQETAISR